MWYGLGLLLPRWQAQRYQDDPDRNIERNVNNEDQSTLKVNNGVRTIRRCSGNPQHGLHGPGRVHFNGGSTSYDPQSIRLFRAGAYEVVRKYRSPQAYMAQTKKTIENR